MNQRIRSPILILLISMGVGRTRFTTDDSELCLLPTLITRPVSQVLYKHMTHDH